MMLPASILDIGVEAGVRACRRPKDPKVGSLLGRNVIQKAFRSKCTTRKRKEGGPSEPKPYEVR